jgi:hypothetical protein
VTRSATARRIRTGKKTARKTNFSAITVIPALLFYPIIIRMLRRFHFQSEKPPSLGAKA